VIGVFVVLGFGGCMIAFLAIVQQSSNTLRTGISTTPVFSTAGASLTVDEYYQAIQQQDYSLAYLQLGSQATIAGQQVTQSTFTQLAQTADNQKGQVTSFQATPDPNDPTHFSVSVTRNSGTYTVHLMLTPLGSSSVWEITQADGI
jgi:hypothetical protein